MTYLGKPKIFIDHPEIVFGFSKKEIEEFPADFRINILDDGIDNILLNAL